MRNPSNHFSTTPWRRAIHATSLVRKAPPRLRPAEVAVSGFSQGVSDGALGVGDRAAP